MRCRSIAGWVQAVVSTSPRPAFIVPRSMSNTFEPKRKRGPVPTGKGVQVGEGWHPSELAAIDAWIASSSDKTLTRAHAIRRLVALGLRATYRVGQSKETQRLRARELAGRVIDGMTDVRASLTEQAGRKRRLIKGPEEFRGSRVDRPKKK
jgi:hypothetical protein